MWAGYGSAAERRWLNEVKGAGIDRAAAVHLQGHDSQISHYQLKLSTLRSTLY